MQKPNQVGTGPLPDTAMSSSYTRYSRVSCQEIVLRRETEQVDVDWSSIHKVMGVKSNN